jgi:hypothetical protein
MSQRRRYPLLRAVSVAAVSLTLSACLFGGGGNEPPPAPVAPAPPPPEPVPTPIRAEDRLYYDENGGFTDSLRTVIKDQDRYRQVWDGATRDRANPVPLRTVDFGSHMVVLVSSGASRLGDEIHVDSLIIRRVTTSPGTEEDVLFLTVRTVSGCGEFDVTAYPLEIVRVQRFEGRVEFSEKQVQKSCQPSQAMDPTGQRTTRSPPAWGTPGRAALR